MDSWWRSAVIYQIYPRSFKDANGDGIGDLAGIRRQLDYLQWLGVDAIWISPVYPSPMADFGYDVTDYRDIDPRFGSMADMDGLIADAHARGLKIILDFVPNHTSDQHPWFLESRTARDNPKRDYYIWRDPAPDGGPPNNWLSVFGGDSAWEWDALTGQYYLHFFLKEQPDLNWRNPAVREAMLDHLRFWFQKGVDGFRVDVAERVMKDPLFRDNPVNTAWRPGMNPAEKLIEKYSNDTPDNKIFNRWLRGVADEFDDRLLIGEIYLPVERLVRHYGNDDEFHLPFNFGLIGIEWRADIIRDLVGRYEKALPPGAWPNWVLSNHDRARIASRVGRDQSRVAMLLLLTLRGTPTLYYGDELGMENVPVPPELVQDPWEKQSPGLGLGRDPVRTPMRWTAGVNAGFCEPGVAPWLPVGDHVLTNVAVARNRPDSMLRFTRRLLQLRQARPALQMGTYRALPAPDGVFCYERRYDGERLLIALNLSDRPVVVPLPETYGGGQVVLETHAGAVAVEAVELLSLAANGGVIFAPPEQTGRQGA